MKQYQFEKSASGDFFFFFYINMKIFLKCFNNASPYYSFKVR